MNTAVTLWAGTPYESAVPATYEAASLLLNDDGLVELGVGCWIERQWDGRLWLLSGQQLQSFETMVLVEYLPGDVLVLSPTAPGSLLPLVDGRRYREYGRWLVFAPLGITETECQVLHMCIDAALSDPEEQCWDSSKECWVYDPERISRAVATARACLS